MAGPGTYSAADSGRRDAIYTVSQKNCATVIYATADDAVAYMFYRCFFLFFFVFFPSTKTMRQPFSGTAERIFMKLLPNDTGKHGV